ncbi:MAG TPA: DUF3300 domain-containing protein [Chthoniobacterales bacterium]
MTSPAIRASPNSPTLQMDDEKRKLMSLTKSGIRSFAVIGILCGALTISLGQSPKVAQIQSQPSPAASPVTTKASSTTVTPQKIPNDQLDALVAPIALYPDPLLGQTLVASTYPLEIIQLEQWLKRNPKLKDKALADAVQKQPWDPSIQAMAILPEVVNRLAENVAWTTDLGNAFLAQQSDVMAAIQRMRAKAQSKGTLKTTAEQVVKTEPVDNAEVIVIQQANPEVVYVPSYDPMMMWGALSYPYYPYNYSGYYSGMGLAFGTGLVLGAAWGGGWGYGCGWGNGDININNKNNYVNHYNRQNNVNRGQGHGGKWQHNPQHRGGAPYGDRSTASKYGGRARQQPAGGTAANRASGGTRPGGGAGIGTGTGARPGGGGKFDAGFGSGNVGFNNIGSNRSGDGFGGAGNRAGGGGLAGNRPGGGAGASNLPATRPGGGAGSSGFGDRAGGGRNSIGGRHTSISEGSGSSIFGGGGYSGNSIRSNSSRGSSSMGGGGFGGGGRGGGFGGGGRGGGGGRRR